MANVNKITLLTILLFIPLLLLIIWAAAIYLPPGVDWHDIYRPTTHLILKGISPYEEKGFHNPPWTLIPLIPIALLPENYGRAVFFIVSIMSLIFVAQRLGARPLAIVFLLLSPPVWHGLLNGNVDWMAAIGFILPPQIGLFFISIKPQMGITVGIFWLADIWINHGIKETVKVFWPFTLVLVISFITFGLWPISFNRVLGLWWNASLWPLSIPIGLGLLVAAIRKRNMNYAMAASPCFAPYILLHSYVGVLLAIVHSLPELIAAVVGLWILVGFQFLGV